MNFLSVENFSVDLKEFKLKNISLSLDKGDYCTIIGPTGAGKTILLESIIGFHKLQTGRVFLDNKEITHHLPEKRKIGIVYQDYALMPHFTIYRNIEYGLEKVYNKKVEKELIRKKITEISAALNITHLLKRTPGTLSGGEQQRASLARALVVEPKMLLMDEPLSALDPSTRRETRILLKKIIKKIGMTVIHITHDFEDVWSFANKVSIFKGGEQIQFGTILDVFERPKNDFVASFLGTLIYDGKISKVTKNYSVIDLNGLLLKSSEMTDKKQEVTIAIRPENIIITDDISPYESRRMNIFEAKLTDIVRDGNVFFGLVEAYENCFKAIIPHWTVDRLQNKIDSNLYAVIHEMNVKIL